MSSSTVVPSTQQALRVHKQGGDFVLDANVPVPTIQPHQVLVKVKAVGLNPVDWKLIDFNWFGRPFPQIYGYDLAGTIAAVGSEVQGWSVGDDVLALKDLTADGALAEYSVTEGFRLARKPAAVSFTDAASLPVAYLSAYEGLVLRANITDKDIVYIPGAAGGVGHFAAQIAKIKGARVIASASREEGLKYLASFLDKEKDLVLNYKTHNVAEEINKFTQGQGVTVIYDALYDNNQQAGLAALLREGGRYAYLQNGISEFPNDSSSEELKKIFKEKKLTGHIADLGKYCYVPDFVKKAHDENAKPLEEALKWIAEKKLKPHAQVLKGWNTANEGLKNIRQGKVVGKVVVDLA